jgi:hypothetical protein
LNEIETEKASEVPVEWALLKASESNLKGCDNKEWLTARDPIGYTENRINGTPVW